MHPAPLSLAGRLTDGACDSNHEILSLFIFPPPQTRQGKTITHPLPGRALQEVWEGLLTGERTGGLERTGNRPLCRVMGQRQLHLGRWAEEGPREKREAEVKAAAGHLLQKAGRSAATALAVLAPGGWTGLFFFP